MILRWLWRWGQRSRVAPPKRFDRETFDSGGGGGPSRRIDLGSSVGGHCSGLKGRGFSKFWEAEKAGAWRGRWRKAAKRGGGGGGGGSKRRALQVSRAKHLVARDLQALARSPARPAGPGLFVLPDPARVARASLSATHSHFHCQAGRRHPSCACASGRQFRPDTKEIAVADDANGLPCARASPFKGSYSRAS